MRHRLHTRLFPLLQFVTARPRRAQLSALLALVLLLGGWLQVSAWYRARQLADKQAEIATHLTHEGEALTAALNRRVSALRGLAAFMVSHQDDVDPHNAYEAEQAMKWLYGNVAGTRLIAAAPDGVQSIAYPSSGVDLPYNLDLLQGGPPQVLAAVRRAVQTRRSTALYLPASQPAQPNLFVFDAVYDAGALWGLVLMGFDFDVFIRETNFGEPTAGTQVALRDNQGHTLYGSESAFLNEPLLYRPFGADVDWVLAAAPLESWDALIAGSMVPFQAVGLTLNVLVVVVVYLVVGQQGRLQTAVRQRTEELRHAHDDLELRVKDRTAELTLANEELSSEIAVRKRIAGQLRESEGLYRTLVMTSPDAVTVADRDGRVTFASDRARHLFGYDYSEEMLGRPLPGSVIPAERPRAREKLQRLLDGRQLMDSDQFTLRRKDGRHFIGEVDSASLRDDAGQSYGVVSITRDITRRVEMQDSLARSEARFRSLIENAPVGITLARHGVTLYANAAYLQLFGYDQESELVGTSLLDQIAPDQRAAVLDNVRKRDSGGAAPGVYETMGLKRDGSQFPFLVNISRLDLPDGPANIAFFTDITERKQTEEALRRAHDELEVRVHERTAELSQMNEALRESEEKYRAIVENSLDGITLVDETGVILEWNAGQERITHIPRTEAVGQFIWDVQLRLSPHAPPSPERYDQVRTTARRFLAEGQLPGQTRQEQVIVWPDGEQRIIQPLPSPITTERGHMIVSITRDVTVHKEAEEALRQSEVRFRTAANFTYDWEYWLAPEGNLVYISPSCERITGYPPAEFLRDPTLLDRLIHPDDAALMVAHTHAASERGDLVPIDYRIRRSDGAVRWIGHVCRQVFDESGQPLGRRVSNRDITERKMAEDALREHEQLYRNVFESVADGLAICDLTGLIVEANPAFCQMHGYECGETVGRRLTSFIHPTHRHVFADSVNAIRSGETLESQAVHLRQDDRPFHVEVRSVGLAYYGRPHLLNVVRDVSVQVEAYMRLEQRVTERTHELSMLLEFSHSMTRTLEMKPLLRLILNQLRSVVDYTGATILSMVGSEMVLAAHQGPIPESESRGLHVPIDSPLGRAVLERLRPVIITDVHGDSPLAQAFQATLGETLNTTLSYIRSWLGIPLIITDRIVGMLAVSHRQPNYFTQRHADLALAFANQAVMAMENARLYEQAQDLAAMQERQRLARDLHDSVSQTLFSASLAAQVLPRLWERQPEEGRQCLTELSRLTRGALAEMRTLLVELRPNVLVETKLGDLLQRLADAITSRTRVPVQVIAEGHAALPPDVQVALYRIAQEALNNVAKHANASQAVIRLQYFPLEPAQLAPGAPDQTAPVSVELSVKDDGRGFQQAGIPADHLGLGIMRERAEAINARLMIDSEIGCGTQVVAIWPQPRRHE
jgi:PAS domain S-box-containing protein